jgi:hypothetical protein
MELVPRENINFLTFFFFGNSATYNRNVIVLNRNVQAMIAATRKWFRRNRTSFAIGFGFLGVGYVATQYVLGKISDARERMSSDRIAREKYANVLYRYLTTFSLKSL